MNKDAINVYRDNLPYSQEAEESVLGGLMKDNATLAEVNFLIPDHFYDLSNKRIYSAILKLAEKGEPFDALTLDSSGLLIEKSLSYLADMVRNTPSVANIKSYAKVVLDRYMRRQLIIKAREIEKTVFDRNADINQISERYAKEISSCVIRQNTNELISADNLEKIEFPKIRWILPDLIPAGLTLLSGAPKLGKSWLAQDLSLTVANGDVIFNNYQVDPGAVLYLALEDNYRRLQNRQRRLLGFTPAPENLVYGTKWPRIGSGCVEALRAEIEARDLRLIIIDTLAMIRPLANEGKDNPYQADYIVGEVLRDLTNEYNIGILILHHTNKQDYTSAFDKISGTTGLQGTFDNLLVLRTEVKEKVKKRIEDEDEDEMDTRPKVILNVTGRDVEREDYVLIWDKDSVKFIKAEAVDIDDRPLSPERREILDIVTKNWPIRSREVAKILHNREVERNGKEDKSVQRLLAKLKAEGLIVHDEDGYAVDMEGF